METTKFINLLKKRKWLLIGVPLGIVIFSFFVVRYLSDTYVAQSRMSTGLVDRSQQVLGTDAFQESKINSDFSNLMEMIKLDKVGNQLSLRLILHDLTDSIPFRPPSKFMKDLNADARAHAIAVYTRHYQNRLPLSSYNKDEKGLLKLISSMEYDYQTIAKNLKIVRPNYSDFIDLDYESENPNLSAFVVNTLTQEFIAYYTDFVRNNQQKTVSFLDTLLHQKEAEMNRLKNLLKNYKIENRVLNLAEQAKSLYGQLADFESKEQLAEKDVTAFSGALKGIEDKFNPSERKYLESTSIAINQQIAATKQFIMNMSDEYIKSNYDEKIKRKLDSARNAVTSQIQQSTDRYILNPLAAKENLVLQKIRLELDLDIARFSLTTLKEELVKLNQKFDMLVPHEAVIQNYEGAIDVASKEYLDAQFRYNKSSLESSLAISLRQIEFGIPGPPNPSKKTLLVVLSGLISLVICLLGLFFVYYFDTSVTVCADLAELTQLPVLGCMPLLTNSVIQFKTLWETAFDENIRLQTFKEMLRSCRFEIDQVMDKQKVLMVNSLCMGEGKSLFSMSLAYAYLMTRKRVLLIDGNFANPSISKSTGTEFFLQDYLASEQYLPSFRPITEILVMGNRGGDTSLLEVCDSETIERKMNELREAFDIIIVEVPGLSSHSKSKEWTLFADKVLCVFSSGRKLSYSKKQSIMYLKGLDQKFIGWIMNKEENERIFMPQKEKANRRIFSQNIELQWA